MPRRRRRKTKWIRRLALGLVAIPALYLLAALLGALVPVNRGWTEPAQGIPVYIADNGIHTDLVMPVAAGGLDWSRLLPLGDMAAPPPGAKWIAIGTGEREIYLDTPTWADLTARNAARAMTGGRRVMHVEYVDDPRYAVRQLRLRPEEYRRLWAAVRAGFVLAGRGRPVLIDHPGYGPADGFYEGAGKASAISTCNQWTADTLRLAGVRASLWAPFPFGVTWRYRKLGA